MILMGTMVWMDHAHVMHGRYAYTVHIQIGFFQLPPVRRESNTSHATMGAVHTGLGRPWPVHFRRVFSDRNAYQYSKPWEDLISGGNAGKQCYDVARSSS